MTREIFHKRLLSALLALTLLAGTAVPALCAGPPGLTCETGVEDGIVSLYPDGSAIYGIQVELLLRGEFARCVFIPSSPTAYDPSCSAEKSGGDAVVIIYLTDRTAMNNGRKLDLGKLDLVAAAFQDVPAGAYYAVPISWAAAMSWAVDTGLATGSDGKLAPGGNAVRAQVATIFQRMCVNLLRDGAI